MSEPENHQEIEQAYLTESEQEAWRELHNKPTENLTDEEVTSKIRLSIKRRFSSPEWVLVFEFGGPNGRRADAIAVNTLPSRNHKVVGFEFKASRSDWLREKKEGEKADHFVRLCDEWYVVAGRTGIVDDDELPEGWGLFELKPNSEQIWQLQESALTDYQQGEPDRRFWAKFLKKTVGDDSNYTQSDLREAKRRGYEEALEEGLQRQTDYEIEQLRKKANNWEALEEAGLGYFYNLSESDIQDFKLALNLIQSVNSDTYSSIQRQLGFLRDDLERKYDEIDSTLDEFEQGIEELQESFKDVDGIADPPDGGAT